MNMAKHIFHEPVTRGKHTFADFLKALFARRTVEHRTSLVV